MRNLNELKDKHVGQAAFIIGAGPSARHLVNKKLDGVSFAVNSAIAHFTDAQYFVSDDHDVAGWDYFYNARKLSCKKLFFKDKLLQFKNLFPDAYFYEHNHWTRGKNLENLKCTKDFPVIGARTSTGSAIHLAHIMGCDPIYLIGVDCCMQNGKRYYWEFEGIEPCKRLNGRILPMQIAERHNKDFMAYWEDFASVNSHLNIYNVSNISKVRHFKSVKLEGVNFEDSSNHPS